MKNISINKDARSDKWYVSWIRSDGKQRRKTTKVPVEGGAFGREVLTAKQAKTRALLEGMKIAEKEEESLEKRNNVTVREFLDEYVERRSPYVSKNTYSNHKCAYRRFYAFLGKRADEPIYLIRRDDARRFADLRRQEVRAASAYKDIHCICPAFTDAYDREIIDRNPFARLSIEGDTKDEVIKREAFTLDEIRLIIEKFPPEWSSAVRCCFETYGQRLGDILSLKWGQFDFEKRVVHIKTGKTGLELSQPMRQGFYEWALNEFTRREARVTQYVHPKLYAMSPNRASNQFGELLRSYGIGEVSAEASGKRRRVNSKSFHSIRATCATVLQAAGVSSDMAMKLVGHESESIHRGYVKPDVEQMRRLTDCLPEL